MKKIFLILTLLSAIVSKAQIKISQMTPYAANADSFYVPALNGVTNYKVMGKWFSQDKVDSLWQSGSHLWYRRFGNAVDAGVISGGGGSWGTITGTLSSQTDLQNALNLKANLASPTFTGVPAAPTATNGTNSTQLATTAYVQNAIAGFSGGGLNLNNVQIYSFTYSASSTFTLPSIPSRVYSVTVYNPTTPMNNPYANYTWSGGSTNVTITDALVSGDVIKVFCDLGLSTGPPYVTGKYINGFAAFATLNTDSVTEGSANKFYTDARARASISLTTTGSSGAATYNNTTGVLNVPQYSGGGSGPTLTFTPTQNYNAYGNFVNNTLDSTRGGTIIGTAGAGYFGFTSQSARPTVPSGLGMREYVDSVGRRTYLGANNLSRSFDPGGQSANRVYKFQDRNYTFADSADLIPTARTSISLTTTGTSGAATYNNSTGVLNVPNYSTGGGMTNPMTTLGDIIYEDATPVPNRLAGNITTTQKFLGQVGNASISAAPTWFDLYGSSATWTAVHDFNPTLSGGAGVTDKGVIIAPTISQSSTAGYTGLLVSVFENTIGSGTQNLFDIGTNTAANNSGTYSSKLSVNKFGQLTVGAVVSSGMSNFNGGIRTSATGETNSAFSVQPNITVTATTSVFDPTGNNNVDFRRGMRSSNNTPTTNAHNYSGTIFGQEAVTMGSSGTQPLFTTAQFLPLAITTAAGTLTESSTVYISGQATGATNNYSLHVAAGVVKNDGGNVMNINATAKTTGYTVTATDYIIRADASGGNFNVTLPTAVGITGQVYCIKSISTGTVTVATTSSQNIRGLATATTFALAAIGKLVWVQSNGTDWDVISSN